MTNSGTSEDLSENGVGEGVVKLRLLQLGRISYSAFSNLVSAEGAVVHMMGPARYEIVMCTFQNNIAWNNGGT